MNSKVELTIFEKEFPELFRTLKSDVYSNVNMVLNGVCFNICQMGIVNEGWSQYSAFVTVQATILQDSEVLL